MTQLNPENNPGTHPEIPVEHMPPLEPTADVPTIHSDTVHGEPNWQGVQETFHGRAAIPPVHESDKVLTGRLTAEEELGERAKKNKGHLVVLGSIAAGVALAAGAVFGVKSLVSNDKSPNPESAAGFAEGAKDPDAIKVDGNTYPEKANPAYDTVYGLYDAISPDGTLKDIDKLRTRTKIMDAYTTSLPEAYRLTQDKSYIREHDDYAIIDERSKMLNTVLAPNLQAAANLINMNNPIAQQSRAGSPSLSEDERLLLQGAELTGEDGLLKEFLAFSGKEGQPAPVGLDMYTALAENSPNDASLRATVCPFDEPSTPRPAICDQAELETDNLVAYSTFTENENDALITDGQDEPNNFERRQLFGEFKIGIVWTNSQGEIVKADAMRVSSPIVALGKTTDPTSNTTKSVIF